MRFLYIVRASLFTLLGACATTPIVSSPATPPPDWKLASVSPSVGNHFVSGSGGQQSMAISGRFISGPTTNLEVSGGHIRGTHASGASVDVSLMDTRGEGLFGNRLFSCVVDVRPDGSVHATGAMGAGTSDFVLSQNEINGRIGSREYQLTWDPEKEQYVGQMDPGGYRFLQLPVSMSYWTDTEFTCTLALLLTGANFS